ncbi:MULTISPECIES: trypsin-like peptidase domain-containing protein [Cyanophyceae]|uniref:trypsin-like peptidase domain-containing protein n=1 Tax=Cyanophyceae TaxID=3028117 RepID=UPI00232AD967|nr:MULTISPECIES: trypsin-like peptidase domain-containing protein [Cyanophyceae]MDB9357034.1 trypsin-like peptidase domain-containing protein [Nodularia spumigena CS-587/03]MDB9338686.1 trypsin-like peptidase domain-containing protein [Nodularia spumigena CS-589/07]MDB9401840.1 trypsin-like peptidase domain-containing protein [Microcystis aeruginosa CS-567/02-A1]MDB9498588.1 trypsin-like peptidase domain-containing protein [Nodularia spumigena CS-336/02]MDB9534226.1 trypsin-like peptidase doma
MSNEGYSQILKAAIARIYRTYHNGTTTVVGAGFLVGDRYLLTCAHVIAEALGILNNTQEQPSDTIELDFPLIEPGKKLKAKVVFWQPVNPPQIGEDIAGLYLEDAPPVGVSPVQLVTATDYWEHKFRIFGFPKGNNDGVWATGELRDVQATGWIQMESIRVPGYQIEPGFSGAPVWDDSLKGVVGMAIAAERKREGVKAAFMIPTKVLMQTWNLLNQAVQQQPKSLSQPLSRVQAIKAKELNKRLEILSGDFEAVYNQLNYTENAGSRNNLQRQLKAIEQEMNDVELQLNELEHGKK